MVNVKLFVSESQVLKQMSINQEITWHFSQNITKSGVEGSQCSLKKAIELALFHISIQYRYLFLQLSYHSIVL